MIKDVLISICTNHKLALKSLISYCGRCIEVYIDGILVENGTSESNFLNDWVKVDLHNLLIDKFEINDPFICDVFLRDGELVFDFEFDASSKYDEFGIEPGDLLPDLTDLISQFGGLNNLDFEEENVFCSFSYDEDYGGECNLEIHDFWCELPEVISFVSNLELIEKLKMEIIKRIKNTFDDYGSLSIRSEDGIDISIFSLYKEEFSFNDFLNNKR